MSQRQILIIFLMFFLITGCTIRFGKKATNENGGIYLSYENGDSWTLTSTILTTSGSIVSFQGENINFLIMDPTDNQAYYAGTGSGLYYTYNGNLGWHKTLNDLGNVNDLAVDPTNRCRLFAAVGNRLYKSADCARHWEYTLIEQSNPAVINSIAIDNYNPKNILVGTTAGGLFKSEDQGNSWRNLRYFDSPIVKIIYTPSDTRIVYIVTAAKGIFKTTDSGDNWAEITDNIRLAIDQGKVDRNCGNFREYRNLVLDPKNDNRLLYASRCLYETNDRGANWQQIRLLTRPPETNIYGLAISYSDPKVIYYGTNTTFYRTIDNGNNWVTKDLPTTRAASQIITDPENPTLIIIGTNNLKK